MENISQKNHHGKNKIILLEILIIICSSILIHYILNSNNIEGISEWKFSQSLALAAFLRITFNQIIH